VAGSPVLLRAHAKSFFYEVRSEGHGWYYVTIGNLFGSQTVECASAEVTFEVLNIALNRKGNESLKLPLGAEIVDA
jgi:hypothetical protein